MDKEGINLNSQFEPVPLIGLQPENHWILPGRKYIKTLYFLFWFFAKIENERKDTLI